MISIVTTPTQVKKESRRKIRLETSKRSGLGVLQLWFESVGATAAQNGQSMLTLTTNKITRSDPTPLSIANHLRLTTCIGSVSLLRNQFLDYGINFFINGKSCVRVEKQL